MLVSSASFDGLNYTCTCIYSGQKGNNKLIIVLDKTGYSNSKLHNLFQHIHVHVQVISDPVSFILSSIMCLHHIFLGTVLLLYKKGPEIQLSSGKFEVD